VASYFSSPEQSRYRIFRRVKFQSSTGQLIFPNRPAEPIPVMWSEMVPATGRTIYCNYKLCFFHIKLYKTPTRCQQYLPENMNKVQTGPLRPVVKIPDRFHLWLWFYPGGTRTHLTYRFSIMLIFRKYFFVYSVTRHYLFPDS
jgi:hypothetical protein